MELTDRYLPLPTLTTLKLTHFANM